MLPEQLDRGSLGVLRGALGEAGGESVEEARDRFEEGPARLEEGLDGGLLDHSKVGEFERPVRRDVHVHQGAAIGASFFEGG